MTKDQWQVRSNIISWHNEDMIFCEKELTVKEAQTICAILNAKIAVPRVYLMKRNRE